jgi:hypothetical protein
MTDEKPTKWIIHRLLFDCSNQIKLKVNTKMAKEDGSGLNGKKCQKKREGNFKDGKKMAVDLVVEMLEKCEGEYKMV